MQTIPAGVALNWVEALDRIIANTRAAERDCGLAYEKVFAAGQAAVGLRHSLLSFVVSDVQISQETV